ncbi:DsbA family protein [Qipengyuania citrea]|uniref:DsbA family protein n=1 Tax=Qipengyuania citrea TaxID=225971 RepID=A0ABY4U4L6_9SPHN|nr:MULTISPECIES: DsbA family protein [Erythrobacteraceae]MAG41484.1 disulfide bond formation protein DsbA [Erythrobacteraceae bacterium]MBL4896596.1 DsbA family protein [Erythrobacter sp.]MAP70162.1 disulfide bond formation protein DsbA [Erythrobacteraceae bacterium]MBY8335312.1 DsbA family protein [Qipengyuania pacifica]MCH2497599.1 DsbA family protein [Erythrobacter sp.]
MPRWPLVAALLLATAGGTALVTTQLVQGDPASQGDAGSDEDTAASAEAMAARAEIADDPIAPKLAPEGYDVTIISYSDYQCPFCRKIHPELERLAQEDGKVRIVYRDWPIFGPASEEAARMAIASQWQNKHRQFNDALMRTDGKLSSEKIRAAAAAAGIDFARLERDMETREDDIDGVLRRTAMQAAQMGLQGTPAMLVGPYMIPGAVDYAGLTRAVAEARRFNAEHAAGKEA